VRHERERAGTLVQEPLQALEPVEVEIVRRLVEEQEVEAREEDRRERRSRGLAPGEGRRLLLERDRQPELGADRPRSRLQVAAAQREEAVERRGVRVALRRVGGEGRAELLELLLSPGRASASCGR
jgi:hypothetical protein